MTPFSRLLKNDLNCALQVFSAHEYDISLAEIAINTSVSLIPEAMGAAETKSAINVSRHVLVVPICVASTPNGIAKDEPRVATHRRANKYTTSFESLKTARMRKKKRRQLRGTAKAASQAPEDANA